MYEIQKTEYGYAITFGGNVNADEMRRWVRESKTALANAPRAFGVIVDMRDLSPLLWDAHRVMEEGQKLFREKGMVRSAVVVAKPQTASQFKLFARATGLAQWERYIDASGGANWREIAMQWVTRAEDPEAAQRGVA